VGSFHILSFLFLPAWIVFYYFPSLHTKGAAFVLLYCRHGSYGILIKLWTCWIQSWEILLQLLRCWDT
jgi:hypothetical protein